MKKLGFVIPWYHKDIPGGAEMELRGTVKHLQLSGFAVEILTTCVKDFNADWTQNYFQPGMDDADGIPVRRFKVRKGDMEKFHKVNYKLMNHMEISLEEEDIFLREMVNSPDLYTYLKEHKEEYEVLFFIPYMFGTTYFGMQACLEKAVLIPCLHDEPYAYFRRFKEVFGKIRGMVFHAWPESDLAHRLFCLDEVCAGVLGEGVETEYESDASRFREKYGIHEPYILYAGRKDSAKNVDTLIRYFREFKLRNDMNLKLVLIGGGSIEIPQDIAHQVADLGFLPVQDKHDACAGSLLLCQPSKNESFSIVIMESWLGGRPVLVHEACNVTSDFARRTRGGLYFKDYFEFEGCVRYLLAHPETADQMGQNGRAYVLSHFSWEAIVEKYKEYIETLRQGG